MNNPTRDIDFEALRAEHAADILYGFDDTAAVCARCGIPCPDDELCEDCAGINDDEVCAECGVPWPTSRCEDCAEVEQLRAKPNASANLAEVIPFNRNTAAAAERLADLDERIRAAVELASELIGERIKLEGGVAR